MGATNSQTSNFKTPMDHRSSPEWRYKQRASRQVPGAFQMAIDPAAPDQVSFVFIGTVKGQEPSAL